MERSSKKIIGGILIVVGIGLISWGVFAWLSNNNVKDTSDPISAVSEDGQSSDSNFEKIEDFSSEDLQVDAEKKDDDYYFESESGENVVSKMLPDDFPEDVHVPESASLDSVVKASSQGGPERFTVFWRFGNIDFDFEEQFGVFVKEKGWSQIEIKEYDSGGYYRFEKSERKMDVSVTESEEDGVDMIVTVDVE